jgi:uncharacterized protein
VAVLGDLGDGVESEPLRALTAAAPLQNLAAEIPAAERYSVIIGGLSQVPDHILVTPSLRARLTAVAYAHFNADAPESLAGQPTPARTSGHDPPLARFRLVP